MLFLLLFVAVALGAITVVCLPLLRGVPMTAGRAAFDQAVYRDQLREVDRDVARGVLNAEEAGSARLEIQRRLLAADAQAERKIWSAPSPRLAAIVAALLLVGSVGLYLHFGSPSLPDAPYAGRIVEQRAHAARGERTDLREAAESLEKKLRATPSDAQGWVLLGRTEATLGEWGKASDAFGHAVALGRHEPGVMAAYGEVQVMAAGGIVSPGAHAAFASALAADPKNAVARYYLAVADAQAGDDRGAIAKWLALAADLPDDSSMRDDIARGVAEAAKSAGIAAPALPKGTAPRPQATAAPREAPPANAMSDAQRKRMIEGMVVQLANHLQRDPSDLEGWLRLGRSYAVLGNTSKSVTAFAKAAALKPDDPDIEMQEFQAMIAPLPPNAPLPAAAAALLRQVAALTPDQPRVLWYLGVEAANTGKPEDARRDWTKLLAQLSADSEDAKLVRTALASLPKK